MLNASWLVTKANTLEKEEKYDVWVYEGGLNTGDGHFKKRHLG